MKAQSFAAISGRIDKGAGVIFGVSVITEGVARGHNVLIDATTVKQVNERMAEFADGTKVKANHWSGFEGIVGSLKNPRIEGEQLRADFHLLNEHDMSDLILEMAEKQPSTFGFSIAFSGTPEEKDKLLYARVTELYSVDLVDDPAANPSGLFAAVDSKRFTKRSHNMIESIKDFFSSFREIEKPYREEITTLNARISELTKAKDGLESEKTELTTRITALETKVKETEASVDKLAAAKALEIANGQGIQPVPQGATATTVQTTELETQLKSTDDPYARTRIYRQNREKIKALAEAQKNQRR